MIIIKNLREQSGLTQSELAKNSGLSLRTIQRLEVSNAAPKGHTLKALANAFEIEMPDFQKKFLSVKQAIETDLLSINLINLSVLAFLGIPFGNIILPVILWRKKRESKLVDEVGRKIINLQIIWTILFVLLLCISPFIDNFFFKPFPLIIIVLFSAIAINLVIVYRSAILIRRGEIDFLNLPIRLL